jgi:UDP-GlcNAc:undecaprenyl-phosphate/decaprenyl-phosphate GlcNAc-1-phosphate transferase
MSEYVLTLLAAAAVTYILTPLVRRFAVAVGAMHAARERDVHELPTPLLGGFAIYGGLVAALLLASRLSGLSSVFAETNMEKGLLLAGGLVVIMGFVDDRWGMGALSKLAGQVAAGVILVWSGAEIPWIPAPGGVTLLLTSDQQIAVTILVVVVTMNAVNFIDGLDGLAAGIVGIGAVAFFAYYYTLTHRLGLVDQTEPALVSILLAGVCIGFLPHNFYPARIFMGDTGSLLIGLMLAYAPISSLALLDPASLTDTAAYAAGTVNRYGAFIPLLVPAAILLIPYADLLMAVVRRTRAGKSVFAPDKKHLQHRLLAIGHSHRTSVLIMYLWAALFSGSVIWLSIVRTPLIVLAIVTVGAIVALLLVTMPRLRPWSRVTTANGTAHVARRAAPVPVPVEAAGERAAVTAPSERAAWQSDGRTALGGTGAPSSGTAGNGATGDRTAGKGAGGNGASRGESADRGGTGSDGTGNRAKPGSADQITGVPGGGTTSGPGIPAASISGGALPGDPPEPSIARASTRGAAPWEVPRRGHPPWETHPGFPAQEPARGVLPPALPPWDTARGGPPWDTARGGPPWETVRGGPPWDTARGGPPWETVRGDPPWETVRGDPPWDTVRNDEPPAGSGSDSGPPPWPPEPPPLP